jgi:hypothetical protein
MVECMVECTEAIMEAILETIMGLIPSTLAITYHIIPTTTVLMQILYLMAGGKGKAIIHLPGTKP